MRIERTHWLLAGWCVSLAGAVGMRAWNAIFGPLFYGYDAWGHISYVFFLDMFRAIPYADQGWSYFHPPLHYLFGWLLMQAGDPKLLVVGLSLLGGAASLGVAALAVGPIRRALPERPGLALLGFSAIAWLPVHVYVSPMPGNEMTATFLAAAAFACHLRNECRDAPRLSGDLATGVLAGLAMLSKFTDAVPCLAIFALTGLRWLRSGNRRAGLPRAAARSLAIALPLLLLAGPYYARNVAEFGTPLVTSAAVYDVARIQGEQPPGSREVLDYLRFPLAMFDDSLATAPHMLRAVWPNTYLNAWFDTFRESQLPFPRNMIPHPFIHQLTILFGFLGLVPTLVALYGAGICARRAFADRGSCLDLGMLVLAAGTLAAFVLFSIRVPTWAALKASYLLNGSLPFAFFMARGAASLARRDAWLGALPGAGMALVALATFLVMTSGLLLRRDFDSQQMVSVIAHFGDFGPTRRVFRVDEPLRSHLEARAAAELYAGDPAAALRFYQHASRLPLRDPAQQPYYLNRRAVAIALEGRHERAIRMLDQALEEAPDFVEALVNRGVLAARTGDLAGAERDLRRAVELDASLAPAWWGLAEVLDRTSRSDDAAQARARAAEVAAKPPRGFPHGVGNGYLYDSGAGQRFMLRLGASGTLSLYRPARARNHPAR